MRLPDKVWARLNEFVAQRQTGHIILHFHEGVLTKYECGQVVKVPRWGACVVDHGALVTEHEENSHG